MNKRAQHLPTASWLIANRFRDYMAYAFLTIFIVSFVTVWSITYAIRRDCKDVYKRDVKWFGYWLHVDAGSTKLECPQHEP